MEVTSLTFTELSTKQVKNEYFFCTQRVQQIFTLLDGGKIHGPKIDQRNLIDHIHVTMLQQEITFIIISSYSTVDTKTWCPNFTHLQTHPL